MNWTALYAILKNSINTTKAELEQEITEKIGLTNQFLDELPEVGESGVLYFIPKDNVDPSAEDQYFMYVWDPDNTEFVLLDPDMDMSPYAKTADLATVATSGSYSDLEGTPDLTPYITEAEADEKYMSGDVLDDETVTGNPVTFESLDGGHAKSCEVTFSPIQDLHGQSNPYPAGGEKNKLPMTVSGIKSANSGATWTNNSCVINDITFTILTDSDDNVIGIKANGTANSDATLIICGTTSAPAIMTFDNNMIVTSGVDNSVDTSIYNNIVWGTSPKIFKEYVNIESNYSMDGFGIRILSGKNANNIVFKPMIRLSSVQDATFAPYSNICPISGRDSLELTQAGKNQMSSVWELGSYGASGQTSVDDAKIRTKTKVHCFPSTRYAISFTTAKTNLWIYYYDSTETFISRSAITSTFTTPNNAEYLNFRCDKDTEGTSVSCMLVIGSSTANYEPYQGETHTATFPDTVYGGKWLPQEGKAVIEWVSVDLGGFDYVYDSTNQLFTKSMATITDILPPDNNDEIVSAISENYKAVSSNNMFVAENNNCFGVSAGKVFRIKDTRYTDSTQFKTAMSGVQLCYELATPTEITLTAEQIELLKGQNVLWTDGDNIELTAAQLELVKVIANPSGQATGTLEKLQINNDIYEMAEPYTELTLKLDAGLTSLTFTDQSITTDSIFEVYTSVYGVNPTDIAISTGSAVLTFESQQSDVNVKIRVWEDKHPLQVSNI